MNYFGYQPSTQNNIVWVNSDQDALNYLLLPNQSVTLRNTNGRTVYFKQTDASGRPTCEAYDLSPHNSAPPQPVPSQNSEYLTRKEFEEYVRRTKTDVKQEAADE